MSVCAPHDIIPMSGWGANPYTWGAIEALTTSERAAYLADAAGVLDDLAAASHDFLRVALLHEVFVRMADALHRRNGVSPISAILRPSFFFSETFEHPWFVGDGSPSDNYLPPLPRAVPHAKDVDGTLRFFPGSLDELRELTTQRMPDYHDPVIDLGDGTRLSFGMDQENFTVWYDGPAMIDAVRETASALEIAWMMNDEPLSEHRPLMYASIAETR